MTNFYDCHIELVASDKQCLSLFYSIFLHVNLWCVRKKKKGKTHSHDLPIVLSLSIFPITFSRLPNAIAKDVRGKEI